MLLCWVLDPCNQKFIEDFLFVSQAVQDINPIPSFLLSHNYGVFLSWDSKKNSSQTSLRSLLSNTYHPWCQPHAAPTVWMPVWWIQFPSLPICCPHHKPWQFFKNYPTRMKIQNPCKLKIAFVLGFSMYYLWERDDMIHCHKFLHCSKSELQKADCRSTRCEFHYKSQKQASNLWIAGCTFQEAMSVRKLTSQDHRSCRIHITHGQEELAMKPNHGDFKIRIVCLALEAVLKKHFYLRLSSIRRTLKPNALLYQSTVFSTSGTYMITYPNFAGPLVWVLAILIIYDSQPDLTACLVLALGYCTSLGTGATNVPRLLSTNASFHIHTLYTYTSLQTCWMRDRRKVLCQFNSELLLQ